MHIENTGVKLGISVYRRRKNPKKIILHKKIFLLFIIDNILIFNQFNILLL
tara:strand:- start:815 stop:967 length:153 start_codon:yes stop_codon:yes gene_type:complete